jgi:hypothetical protein
MECAETHTPQQVKNFQKNRKKALTPIKTQKARPGMVAPGWRAIRDA